MVITSFKLGIYHFDVIFFLRCFDVMFEFHNTKLCSVLIQMYISL